MYCVQNLYPWSLKIYNPGYVLYSTECQCLMTDMRATLSFCLSHRIVYVGSSMCACMHMCVHVYVCFVCICEFVCVCDWYTFVCT